MATIIIGLGSRCIDASGASTNNGTPIILYEQKILDQKNSFLPDPTDPLGIFKKSNQLWTYMPATGFIVSTMDPTKCLDISHGNIQNGSPIILWDNHGGENQKWNLDADGCISNRSHPNMCIDVQNAKNSNGTPLILWEKNGGANQKWNLIDSTDPLIMPSFLQALVTLVPLRTAEPNIAIDLIPAGTPVPDVSPVNGLTSNIAMHIIASAIGTPSPHIDVISNLTWRCQHRPPGQITGVVNNVPLEFTTNPIDSNSSIDISINPFNQVAKTCGGIAPPNPTQSAVAIKGDIKIIATNSLGRVVSSILFFDYLNMPN